MKIIIFSIFILISLAFGMNQAYGCDITGHQFLNKDETYDFSDVVFWGKVVEINQPFPKNDSYSEVFFSVEKIWKGFANNEISLISWPGCIGGPWYELGQNYMVYSDKDRHYFGQNNYSNTTLGWIYAVGEFYSVDEIIDAIGPGFNPPEVKTPFIRFQMENGVPKKDIDCKLSDVLIIKSSNEDPACVKPETATKLIQRGWGTLSKVETWKFILDTPQQSFNSARQYPFYTESENCGVGYWQKENGNRALGIEKEKLMQGFVNQDLSLCEEN